MVIIEKEDKLQQQVEAMLEEEDQAHDGWGPVQLRRSSMPPPVAAQTAPGAARDATAETAAKPLNS
jgi:hypothetical protein